ncbi:prefoldin subunit [Thraustotheca clavata]|uniref:Prefoldin subunit n=1 Tax=Thraustotheca clavata TaxID=74557 RepID=A0A1W0A163_9STRA|nr:prefoldin subunit [Thraustotheca clavata]
MSNEVSLMDLSLEQLNNLKTQFEQELQQLTASFSGLREAQTRFSDSKDALGALEPANLGKKVLVPLTSSMFVPGKLSNVKSVLVDVGTGYFVEKNVPDAKAFMDRKVEFLQKNTESLKEVMEGKRTNLEAVIQVMQLKIRLSEQQGAKHSYIVGSQPGGLSSVIGMIMMEDNENLTFESVRPRIELQQDGSVQRRSIMYQEALFLMTSGPNPHQWPLKSLQTYWLGYYKNEEDPTPTIIPTNEETKGLREILDMKTTKVTADLIVIPQSQIGPVCNACCQGCQLCPPAHPKH